MRWVHICLQGDNTQTTPENCKQVNIYRIGKNAGDNIQKERKNWELMSYASAQITPKKETTMHEMKLKKRTRVNAKVART
ncbi:hypothetical protein POVWA2_060650 [Plasmodium ovale wallikeri]|uniref:Uncharacterized protein n=1 Tax=Plasmodium ovale wallikeri TaxID=864142 RepID=A0A1A8YRZ1_PLAOA|nr:hypothetical protein POVWA1_021010 [Plasmodium ovale wallikeri]SBT50618.1 hypothetical protein POVWA2_060650 [Plasmodium ovale wallikeri]